MIEESPPPVEGSDSKDPFDEFFHAVYEDAVLYVTLRAPGLDVEDIVGEAFTAVLTHWDTVRNPHAYLYATLRNGISTRHKHSGRDALLRRFYVASRPPVTHPDPADLAQSDSVFQEVISAVEQLPEGMRDVALLTLANYKPDEIADLLGVRRSTVTTQLTKANRRLRAILGTEPTQRRNVQGDR